MRSGSISFCFFIATVLQVGEKCTGEENKMIAQLLGQWGFANENGTKISQNFPENSFFKNGEKVRCYFDFFECISLFKQQFIRTSLSENCIPQSIYLRAK
jgi:hypothetical protein